MSVSSISEKRCAKINCLNNDCRFIKEKDPLTDEFICTKDNSVIQFDVFDTDLPCTAFEKFEFCDTCKHGKEVVYETGTIDEIDYYCKLQNINGDLKLIYIDIDPYINHNADFPRCSISHYEPKANQ
jgi:hypothetical protein